MLLPSTPDIHSSIAAAFMLVGKQLISQWAGWPNFAEILAITGAGRSQSFEVAARLKRLIPTLLGEAGRPAQPPPPPAASLEISRAVQTFLLENPGAASHRGRGHYSDEFRRFIVGLAAPGQPAQDLSVAQLAEAVAVPLGTLKAWFAETSDPELAEPDSTGAVHLHQILSLYANWDGSFQEFCRACREQHRLNYGATFIANVLHQAGVRHRKPRKRKASPWDRGTFRTLFPGAQWIGDGTSIAIHGIPVRYGKNKFVFNLELLVDAASNALVGAAVTDSEDQEALLDAFRDACATCGRQSLALSVDNRPSNHTPVVAETLGPDTVLLPTTLGRGQSKAPVEGAYGLFNQEMPALVVSGEEPREIARDILRLVFTAWGRGRNGRPRRKLGQQSPADFYKSYQPSEADIAEAKRWHQKLQRRQEQIRRTRAARADKAKLALLKEMLLHFGIDDPHDQLAVSLAFYSREAIVDGLAVFEAKLRLGTVPDGAIPGRYLGGIIRKSDERAELALLSESFVKNRERLRDLSLEPLIQQAEALLDRSPQDQLAATLRRALHAKIAVDYHFWAARCSAALAALPEHTRRQFYDVAARQIQLSFAVDRERKQMLLAKLAASFVAS